MSKTSKVEKMISSIFYKLTDGSCNIWSRCAMLQYIYIYIFFYKYYDKTFHMSFYKFYNFYKLKFHIIFLSNKQQFGVICKHILTLLQFIETKLDFFLQTWRFSLREMMSPRELIKNKLYLLKVLNIYIFIYYISS